MPRLSKNKNKNKNMVQCKKHPKHKQSPGVCSLCLGEKLSRVSSAAISNNSRAPHYYCSSSSVSSSSEDESSYPSSSASPMREEDHGHQHHRRSWSLPFGVDDADQQHTRNTTNKNKNKKIIQGFWSKFFLRPRRNDNYRVNTVKNDNNNNKVYMSQPIGNNVASSSRMVVY